MPTNDTTNPAAIAWTLDRTPQIWVQWSGNPNDPLRMLDNRLQGGFETGDSWVAGRLLPLLWRLGPVPVVPHAVGGKRMVDDIYTATFQKGASAVVNLIYRDRVLKSCRENGSKVRPYIGWAFDPTADTSWATKVAGSEKCPTMLGAGVTEWIRGQFLDGSALGLFDDRLWLDELSDKSKPAPAYALALEKALRCTVGGEALPMSDVGVGNAHGGRKYILDQSRIGERPWLCTAAWLKGFDPDRQFVVNPKTTEVHVVLRRDDGNAQDLIRLTADLMSRGFIADVGWEIPPETASKLFKMQESP